MTSSIRKSFQRSTKDRPWSICLKVSPGWEERAADSNSRRSFCAGKLTLLLVPQALREHHQRVFRRARADLRISANEADRAFGLQEGEAASARVALLRARAHPAIEEHHRRVQDLGNALQPPGRDAVRALLVLLHLLKRQP